jgi:hypothetical protein
MNLTASGRPIGSFPFFKFRDGEGGYLLVLSRIDVHWHCAPAQVSDVRKSPAAEAFYTLLIQVDARDGMRTLRIGRLYIFIAPRKVQFHVERNQAPEE